MRMCVLVVLKVVFLLCIVLKKRSSDEFGNNRRHQRACVPQSGPQSLPSS